MTAISVPDAYQSGIISLLYLTDEQFQNLFAAIKNAKPSLTASGLVSQLNDVSPTVKMREVREIVEALVCLYPLYSSLDISAHEFAERISSGVNEFTDIDEVLISLEEKEILTTRLAQLFNIDKSIGITSKANEVLVDNNHTYCHSRILTDIRPIFPNDLEITPSEVVIVHNLKISFMEDGQKREFFAAMNPTNLKELKVAIERAELKVKSIQKVMEKAGVQYLEDE